MKERDPRLPPAGTTISAQHDGKAHDVKVLEHGFDYKGTRFGSLSALAKHITGRVHNGFTFFGLGNKAPRAKTGAAVARAVGQAKMKVAPQPRERLAPARVSYGPWNPHPPIGRLPKGNGGIWGWCVGCGVPYDRSDKNAECDCNDGPMGQSLHGQRR